MADSLAELIRRYRATADAFITSVQGMEPAWNSVCPVEGWPVGVTAHHVADWWPVIAGMVERMSRGEPAGAPVEEEVHARNARHAEESSACTPAATLDLLRANRDRVLTALDSLQDADLDRSASMWDTERSIRQLIEVNLIGHPERHGSRMRSVAGVP